jgi:hypothetical protein
MTNRPDAAKTCAANAPSAVPAILSPPPRRARTSRATRPKTTGPTARGAAPDKYLFSHMGTYSQTRPESGSPARPKGATKSSGKKQRSKRTRQKSEAMPLRSQSPYRVGSRPFGPPNSFGCAVAFASACFRRASASASARWAAGVSGLRAAPCGLDSGGLDSGGAGGEGSSLMQNFPASLSVSQVRPHR